MLGHVSDGEARVWIQASERCTPSLIVDDAFGKRIRVAGPELTDDSAFMGHVAVTGLGTDKTYTYTIALNGTPLPDGPHGMFRTAVEPGSPLKLRVAFSSCFGRKGVESAPGRKQLMASGRADLFLELGDNHYADSTEPQKQRAAYLSQRGTEAWHACVHSLPTYGIWDDHDYGPNDSDRTAAGKARSLKTYQQVWANPSYGEADNPGIYSTFHRGDVQFFLLDDRYYRDPNSSANVPTKTVFGTKQKAWIKQQLKDSSAKIKIVAMGSEWQLNGHRDSYTSFKTEQKEMLDFFKTQEGIILLSGDRHFTGAYQIRGETLEVTAGPMGSRNFPTKNLPDMFVNHGAGKMFAVLELDTTADVPTVTLEVHRDGKGVIETRAISWDELNGRKRIPPL